MSVGIIAFAFWASTVSHENTEGLESVKCRAHLYLFIRVVNIHVHNYIKIFAKCVEGLKRFIIITINFRYYILIVTIREFKLNFCKWCRWNWKRPIILHQSNSFDLVRLKIPKTKVIILFKISQLMSSMYGRYLHKSRTHNNNGSYLFWPCTYANCGEPLVIYYVWQHYLRIFLSMQYTLSLPLLLDIVTSNSHPIYCKYCTIKFR